MTSIEKANEILKPLGLAAYIKTVKGSSDYFDLSHLYGPDFKFYSPAWYRSNEKLKESDEVYRFDTTVYLHLQTGIRCEYHIHEYYFEGEEYKLSKIFVITLDNQELEVLDVDYENKFVISKNGNNSFDKLKRHVDKTD